LPHQAAWEHWAVDQTHVIDMSSFPRFLSVSIASIILFQSGIVAPAINLALPVESAAILLRFIWPIFFALIGVMALVGVVVARRQRAGLMVNGATVLGMVICFLLVPVINGAMDNDQLGLWKALHILTVALTFFALVLQLGYLFRWHRKA
jgi:hypothetical protein